MGHLADAGYIRRKLYDQWPLRKAFDHKPAEPVQMHHVFELDAIGEGAAGGNYGILEFDPGKAHFEIRSHVMAGLGSNLGSMLRLSLHKQKVSPATIGRT